MRVLSHALQEKRAITSLMSQWSQWKTKLTISGLNESKRASTRCLLKPGTSIRKHLRLQRKMIDHNSTSHISLN